MFHRCLPSHWDDLISLSMRPDRASCARPTSLQSNPRVSLSPSSITTSLIIHDVAPCFISAEQRQKSGQVTEGREMGMDPAAVLATQTLSGLTELRAGFFFFPIIYWHVMVHTHTSRKWHTTVPGDLKLRVGSRAPNLSLEAPTGLQLQKSQLPKISF